MKTFFTSDCHWGHKNILKYQSNRSIFENIEKHDDELIARWNSKVGTEDTVWLLGDVALCGTNRMSNILHQLNGKIHLILGNHDHDVDECDIPQKLISTNRFESIHHVKMVNIGGQRIWLSHYAHRVWPASHRGVWHLYGHSHGSLPDDPESLSFDVGVDCHNFFPLSFDDVKEIMSRKSYKPVDHHKERE